VADPLFRDQNAAGGWLRPWSIFGSKGGKVTDGSSPHQSNQSVLSLTISGSGAPSTLYSYCIAASPNSACSSPSGGYDAVGNVLSYYDSVTGTWNMSSGYDRLNRLTSASASGSAYQGLQATWSYDSFGNRKTESFGGSYSGTSGVPASSSVHFNDGSNRVTSVDSGYAPGYDSAGNVLCDAQNGANCYGNQYAYDGEGRICAVAGANGTMGYLYDAQGTRIAKGTIHFVNGLLSCDTTLNGFTMTTSYILGPGNEQLTEISWAGTTATPAHTNVFAGGQLTATYSFNNDPNASSPGTLYFHITDWLGTRRALVDYTGELQQACDSLPFGNGEDCPTLPTEHLFTGKERDTESGNDYFGARYYASSMGRFMSPDWSAKLMPVPYAKLDNPQTLNLYAYVGNNPLSRIDADGHYEISCGSGSKNCNQKELDRINKQIAKDQVSKNKARAAAAGAYGGLGEKNGVMISVVDQPDAKNANVNGTTGAQAGTPGFAYTPDGKATGAATAVTLKAGLDGGDLKDAIDHEGQHALDRQNYVNGLMQDATGESSKGLNITGRMSEVNAYTTQGFSPGEIKQQLSKPPYSTDPNIDKPLFPMPSAY